jgi:hypothetical protein
MAFDSELKFLAEVAQYPAAQQIKLLLQPYDESKLNIGVKLLMGCNYAGFQRYLKILLALLQNDKLSADDKQLLITVQTQLCPNQLNFAHNVAFYYPEELLEQYLVVLAVLPTNDLKKLLADNGSGKTFGYYLIQREQDAKVNDADPCIKIIENFLQLLGERFSQAEQRDLLNPNNVKNITWVDLILNNAHLISPQVTYSLLIQNLLTEKQIDFLPSQHKEVYRIIKKMPLKEQERVWQEILLKPYSAFGIYFRRQGTKYCGLFYSCSWQERIENKLKKLTCYSQACSIQNPDSKFSKDIALMDKML